MGKKLQKPQQKLWRIGFDRLRYAECNFFDGSFGHKDSKILFSKIGFAGQSTSLGIVGAKAPSSRLLPPAKIENCSLLLAVLFCLSCDFACESYNLVGKDIKNGLCSRIHRTSFLSGSRHGIFLTSRQILHLVQ